MVDARSHCVGKRDNQWRRSSAGRWQNLVRIKLAASKTLASRQKRRRRTGLGIIHNELTRFGPPRIPARRERRLHLKRQVRPFDACVHRQRRGTARRSSRGAPAAITENRAGWAGPTPRAPRHQNPRSRKTPLPLNSSAPFNAQSRCFGCRRSNAATQAPASGGTDGGSLRGAFLYYQTTSACQTTPAILLTVHNNTRPDPTSRRPCRSPTAFALASGAMYSVFRQTECAPLNGEVTPARARPKSPSFRWPRWSRKQFLVLHLYKPRPPRARTLQRQRYFRPIEGRRFGIQHPFLAEVVEQLPSSAIFKS